MRSTITQTKSKILLKALKAVVVTAFWILIWEAVARFVARDNELMYLLLPRPEMVLKKWLEIGFTREFLLNVGETMARIMSGFLIGVTLGLLSGVLTYFARPLDWMLSPLFKVIRVVPVVAVTLLFFALFKSEALPIWVVTLMVAPLMWQTVYDGLHLPQKELSEMAEIYRLGELKTFFYIKMPDIMPRILTSGVNALGLAWKSGIAAEVICEPDIGLGTVLIRGKGMIDFSTVYAVTLTVVILSVLIELLLRFLCRKLTVGGDGK